MNATEVRIADAIAAFFTDYEKQLPSFVETPKVNGISAEAEAEVEHVVENSITDRITMDNFNGEVSDLMWRYGIAKEPAQHALTIIQAGQVFTALKPKHTAAVAAEDWALAGYYEDQLDAACRYSEDLRERFAAQEVASEQ